MFLLKFWIIDIRRYQTSYKRDNFYLSLMWKHELHPMSSNTLNNITLLANATQLSKGFLFLFSQIENEVDQDSPYCSNETLSSYLPSSFPKYITKLEAKFTNTGGELCAPLDSDVRIIVPKGAIPVGMSQPIFFGVFSDETSLLQDIPVAPDKTLISPVVECGPHKIHLSKPVEIIVPHCLCLGEAKKEWITVYRCGTFPAEVEGSLFGFTLNKLPFYNSKRVSPRPSIFFVSPSIT